MMGSSCVKKADSIDNLVFIDPVDDYVWEDHVYGRPPFREPVELEIVFHNDKLHQDTWSMETLHDSEDEQSLSDVSSDVISMDEEYIMQVLTEVCQRLDGICCESKLERETEAEDQSTTTQQCDTEQQVMHQTSTTNCER
jgi:hypothetical protein